ATGAVTLPDAKNAPIKVTMQTIRLPAPDPKAVSDANAPDPLVSVDPRKIPALDIIIRQLYQGADLLGAWSLNIRPTTRGINLNNLSLGLKGLLLEGSGGWEGVAGASNSWYRGRIGGGNLANVLQGWGFAPSVTSEDFKVDIDGRWPGSPAWIGLNRFSGTLDATLN
ncbi:TIGR02099 family protein, partial [Pseudomonas sp. FSL R10-0071]